MNNVFDVMMVLFFLIFTILITVMSTFNGVVFGIFGVSYLYLFLAYIVSRIKDTFVFSTNHFYYNLVSEINKTVNLTSIIIYLLTISGVNLVFMIGKIFL